jgi:hypothetical protein
MNTIVVVVYVQKLLLVVFAIVLKVHGSHDLGSNS